MALSARGAVTAVFAACVVGCFIASWTRWDATRNSTGGLAVYSARPGMLLPVVVSPPVLFLVACICVKVATTADLLSAMSAAVVTLAGVAGWMITGMGLTVVIALGRGAAREVADLIQSFRQPGFRAGTSARRGLPGLAEFARQLEGHLLGDRLNLLGVVEAEGGQPREHAVDQFLRDRGTAGQADRGGVFHPLRQ
jgi:hypothetical protein